MSISYFLYIIDIPQTEMLLVIIFFDDTTILAAKVMMKHKRKVHIVLDF